MVGDFQTLNQRTPGILLGLAAIVVCLGLRAGGVLEGLELSIHDRLVQRNIGLAHSASPVVTIAIGEAEFDRYGYPIPDAILARSLSQLADAGVAAVGIDLYRDGPASDNPVDLAGWAALAEVVANEPRFIVSELLASADQRDIPAPSFAPADQIGFNNLLMDVGRVVRRGYVFAWDDAGDAHQSLSLRLALLFLARDRIGLGPAPEREEWIRLGETTLPPLETDFGAYAGLDSGGYQFLLDYARDEVSIETLRFQELVEGNLDADRVRGRVVVLGTDAPSVKDDFNAPHQPGRAVKGLRIHAQVTDQLIRMARTETGVRQDWNEWAETGWVIGWGLAGIALSAALASLGWAIPAFVVGLIVLALASAWLFASGFWVPTVAPALAWLSAGGFAAGDRARREAREQHQLMSLFRRFNSRRVADELWSQRDLFMDGGRPRPQRTTITALLSDLKGYTAASEKMEPVDLMEWIDSYMDAMTRVIESHDGHVDDYVGDGIKANFGVPIPSRSAEEIAEDAKRAVRCAVEMGEVLERLNAEWTRRGWPVGRQRIGLFTGIAVVGSIGSGERMKYTSVGDTINSAARLEAIGGQLDFDQETALQRVLIGERTRNAIGEEFEVMDLGAHAVKGKADPLKIYRVIGVGRRSTGEEDE